MKTLDFYIIRKFLGTFFFAILLIISIAIVFDAAEKLEDFMERNAPLKAILLDYYLNFVPYYVNLFLFLFTFISVIYFTSKMASHSEIIAILSSGVSFNRMLVPYMISASVIAVMSFFLSNYIIPPANEKRIAFEDSYIRRPYSNSERNIHKQIEPGVFIYMQSYNNKLNIGFKFSMERFENRELKWKLMSDYIKWDTLNKWRVHNCYVREIDGMNEKLSHYKTLDSAFNFTPDEFSRRDENYGETLTLNELNDHIDKLRFQGTENIETYLIEKYKRTAFPFSTFILTLIGVSLAARKAKRGMGLNIGIGLLISFSYILFMQVSFQFSIGGSMDPLLAVWIPNIIFAFVAIFIYRMAPK